MKKPKQWDLDDTYGSDIHGVGQTWGDMRGKVKTKQIGFVRGEVKTTKRHECRPVKRNK